MYKVDNPFTDEDEERCLGNLYVSQRTCIQIHYVYAIFYSKPLKYEHVALTSDAGGMYINLLIR